MIGTLAAAGEDDVRTGPTDFSERNSMRTLFLATCSLGIAVSLLYAQAPAAPGAKAPPTLKTIEQKASYGIGLAIGRQLREQGFEIDAGLIARGIQDTLSGQEPLLSSQELQEAMRAFQQQMAAKKQERDKVAGQKNQQKGQAFLAANKAKQGIVTLPSGLQYQVVQAGTGATPKATDTVRTHYRGTLINGTEFDSSYKRGEPAEFPVNGVIKGWTEALQLMKVGAKWKLFIPAELAYGERGAGGAIGPHETLIFDIELLEVK